MIRRRDFARARWVTPADREWWALAWWAIERAGWELLLRWAVVELPVEGGTYRRDTRWWPAFRGWAGE